MPHDITTPPPGDTYRREGADYLNLKVSPLDPPSMAVQISEGFYWNNDREYIEYPGANSFPISRPAGSDQARFIVVGLAASGNASSIVGANQSVIDTSTLPQPKLPDIPANYLPLAAVRVHGSDTAINKDDILDLRTAQKMTF
jgi:hypothetical protein